METIPALALAIVVLASIVAWMALEALRLAWAAPSALPFPSDGEGE